MEQQRTHQIIKELNNNVTNSVANEVDNLSTLLVWDLPEEVGVLDSLTNFSFDGSTFDASSIRSPEPGQANSLTQNGGHTTPISYSQIKLSPTQASISALLKNSSSPNSSNVFNFSSSPNKNTSNHGTSNKNTSKTIIGLEIYGKSISPITTSSGRNQKIIETKVSEKVITSSSSSSSSSVISPSKKLQEQQQQQLNNNSNSAFSPLMDNFRSSEHLNISVESAYHGTPHTGNGKGGVESERRSESEGGMMSPTYFGISPTHVSSNHPVMFDEDILNDLQVEWFPNGGSPVQPPAIK